MGLKDLSSMAKILLQLSANSKPFDENDGKKPLVTQSTVITTEDHMTEGDGDDAHHQSTGLILRPLLTKLSQDEKNMLRELLNANLKLKNQTDTVVFSNIMNKAADNLPNTCTISPL